MEVHTRGLVEEDSGGTFKFNQRLCLYLFFARAVQSAVASRDFLDIYIMDLSGSNETVGLVESTCGLAALAVMLPCGVLTDRFPRRQLLRGLAAAKTLPTFLTLWAVYSRSLRLLWSSVVLLVLVSNPQDQVLQVFLIDNTSATERTRILSRKEMVTWLGTALGPLAALTLVALVSEHGAWSISLVETVVCVGLLGSVVVEPVIFFLRSPSVDMHLAAESTETPALPDWTQGKACGVRKRWLIPIWTDIMWALTQIAASVSLRYVPLFFRQDFGLSPSWLMALRFAENISLAALNLATPKIASKLGRAWAAVLFISSGGILMIGVACAHQVWLAALLFVLRTTMSRANVPCVQSIIFESVLPEHRGRWTAITSFKSATNGAGAWIGGVLADRTGDYRASFLATGCIHVACASVFIPVARMVPT
eukprot:s249_g5.t1